VCCHSIKEPIFIPDTPEVHLSTQGYRQALTGFFNFVREYPYAVAAWKADPERLPVCKGATLRTINTDGSWD